MEAKELRGAIEAILFVATEPVKVEELAESFPDEGRELVEAQVEEIRRHFEEHVGGFTLEQMAGGWRFATRAEHDSVLRKFYSKKGEGRLSIAALETLAIIAYRQPITGPEISDIRGVNSSAVMRTLLERKMVRVAGRKNVVGSPFLYRTTKDFLIHFGLNDIRDLPKLDEFAELLGETLLSEELNAMDDTNVEPDALADGDDRSQQDEVVAELNEEEAATFAHREEENLSNEAAARPLTSRERAQRGLVHDQSARTDHVESAADVRSDDALPASENHGVSSDASQEGYEPHEESVESERDEPKE